MPTQEEWDILREEKNKRILLNMAINEVIGKSNYKAVITEDEPRDVFKKEVLALYRVFREIHEEPKD